MSSYAHQSGAMLTAHVYSHCIRRERGYCSISYNAAISSSTIDSFELSDDAGTVYVSKPLQFSYFNGNSPNCTFFRILQRELEEN